MPHGVPLNHFSFDSLHSFTAVADLCGWVGHWAGRVQAKDKLVKAFNSAAFPCRIALKSSVCVGSNTSKVSYSTKDSSVGFETPPRVRLIDLLTIAVTSFICSEKLWSGPSSLSLQGLLLECGCSWKLRTWAKAEQKGRSRWCVSAVPGADHGLSPHRIPPFLWERKCCGLGFLLLGLGFIIIFFEVDTCLCLFYLLKFVAKHFVC